MKSNSEEQHCATLSWHIYRCLKCLKHICTQSRLSCTHIEAGRVSQENIESVSFKLPAEDYNTLATLDFQLKYFNGQGIAIGKGKAYATFADLWNEEPNSFQRQFDGNI